MRNLSTKIYRLFLATMFRRPCYCLAIYLATSLFADQSYPVRLSYVGLMQFQSDIDNQLSQL